MDNDNNAVLAKDQVKEKLSAFIAELKAQETELGTGLSFPAGTMIGGQDFSGRPLSEALDEILAKVS